MVPSEPYGIKRGFPRFGTLLYALVRSCCICLIRYRPRRFRDLAYFLKILIFGPPEHPGNRPCTLTSPVLKIPCFGIFTPGIQSLFRTASFCTLRIILENQGLVHRVALYCRGQGRISSDDKTDRFSTLFGCIQFYKSSVTPVSDLRSALPP